MKLNRRQFLGITLAVAAGGLGPSDALAAAGSSTVISASRLPRWRGFNLLEKFSKRRQGNDPFLESDFALMREWGFDFARLPMSYHCWADPQDWLNLRGKELKDVDQAVAFGKQYGMHVNLNLHRAPGYCVNPPAEPLDLWKDEKALEACAFHWAHFAGRYRGIPNDRLSFDLLNEPANIPEETYARVVRRLVEAIREKDPGRLIVADGLSWGRKPVVSLADLGLAQSTRGYDPMQISHYQASWVKGADQYAEPTWPLTLKNGDVWDKERLRRERIPAWQSLAAKGVGVHVGEWGAFNKTPHAAVLAWMKDSLELWKEAGWGWALWNLRGSFGVLDSQRRDVTYEPFHGHQLDRAMLELLREG